MAGPDDNPFGGYRFHRVLAPGSDVGVYEATDQASGEAVVIETLVGDSAEDEDLRDWFAEAWEEVAALEHPGVVRVIDTGERDGVPFVVREWIEGEELGAVLEGDEEVDSAVAEAWFTDLARTLEPLHEAGVVHGAIGGDTVLIGSREGEPEEERSIFLTGFGRVEGLRSDDTAALAELRSRAGLTPQPGGFSGDEEGIEEEDEDLPADDLGEDEPVPDPGASHRRARRAFLGAVAVAIAAVIAVVVVTSSDEEPDPSTVATAPEDPAPPADVSATGVGSPADEEPAPEDAAGEPIEVSGGPSGVAVRDGVIYTVTSESGELIGFDEETGEKAVGPVDLGGEASEVTIVDDVAWVTQTRNDQVAKVDLSAGKDATAESIAVGEGPTGVIGAFGSIFVAESGSGGLSQVNPETSEVTPLIIGAQEPSGIAYGEDVLWVTDGSGRVQRVDPANPAGSESFEAGAEPRGVLVVEGEVWIANSGDGTVSRLDADSGEGEPIDVGGSPLDLASDGKSIYASNASGYVSSIDIASGGVERIDVPPDLGPPIAVASGEEGIWVTTEEGSLVPLG